MHTRIGTVLFLALTQIALSGCAHTGDVELAHPLVSGTISQNRITKSHGIDEQSRGLPSGALTDEARLTAMNDARVCFAFSMHELTPVDANAVSATLRAPKLSKLDRPEVKMKTASPRSYDGLVPHRERTGVETVCVSRDRYDVCQRWQTRPTYTTSMVPGTVTVYEAKGNLCFRHEGAITDATDQLKLEIKVATQGTPQLRPTSAAGYNPFAAYGAAFGAPQSASAEFSWLLIGGAKKER